MSTADNKAVMRQYYEDVWNQRNLSALAALLAPDYHNHDPFFPGQPAGPEGVPLVVTALTSAFPDLRYEIEDQIAEGDRVVTRWTMTGTHRGELMGIPPTGASVAITGMSIERIVDGRITEHWRKTDELGLLQQLGVALSPEQAPA